jgi:hypothetical protein
LKRNQKTIEPTPVGVQLNSEPPPVSYCATPAILSIVYGDPVLSPVEKPNRVITPGETLSKSFFNVNHNGQTELHKPGSVE